MEIINSSTMTLSPLIGLEAAINIVDFLEKTIQKGTPGPRIINREVGNTSESFFRYVLNYLEFPDNSHTFFEVKPIGLPLLNSDLDSVPISVLDLNNGHSFHFGGINDFIIAELILSNSNIYGIENFEKRFKNYWQVNDVLFLRKIRLEKEEEGSSYFLA